MNELSQDTKDQFVKALEFVTDNTGGDSSPTDPVAAALLLLVQEQARTNRYLDNLRVSLEICKRKN
jgi:hypothetical protein